MGWAILVPIKRLDRAKTRLRGAVAAADHQRLVIAMALDTIRAAAGCPLVRRIIIVSDDPAVRLAVGDSIGVFADAHGLNQALDRAAARLRREPAQATLGIAALTADLPALKSAELTQSLRAAQARQAALAGHVATTGIAAHTTHPSATQSERSARSERPAQSAQSAQPDQSDQSAQPAQPAARCFVSDATGAGTVLLTAAYGHHLDPRFGAGSAEAHRGSGGVPLVGDWPGLRQDVDTPADLARAVELGVGEHTLTVLALNQNQSWSVLDRSNDAGHDRYFR